LVIGSDKLDLRFVHITNDNGLAQNHVTCIMEDHKGFMWFGTRNGLCKYNGYEIQTYLHNINDNNSLSHNFIRSLFQDKKNRIWVGTDKGVCRYIPDRDQFIQYNQPSIQVTSFAQNKDSILFCSAGLLYSYSEKTDKFFPVETGDNHSTINGTTALIVDKSNILWVGGINGLTGYNSNFTKSLDVNNLVTNQKKSFNDFINALYIDSENKIWIGKNGNGVVSFNPVYQKIDFYQNETSIQNAVVRAICQDSEGRMWFGTENGIFVMNNNNSFESIRQNYNKRFGLNDNAIYSIIRDHNNNMWVGTYFGGVNVHYHDFEQFRYYDVGYDANELKGKAIRQIIQEDNDLMWIATEDGGLNRFNRKTGIFTQVKNKNIHSNNIHSLQIDKDKNLWIGTFWGGLSRYNLKTGKIESFNTGNSNLPANNVFTMYVDKNNVVWIGTSSGLCYYDKIKNCIVRDSHSILSSGFIYFITEDRYQNLWIGLRTGGLVRYNKKQNVISHWGANSGKNSLADNFISSILEDSDGHIWIGTNNGGLYLYNDKEDNFQSFLLKNVIPEQCIYGLVEDNDKNLWITTNKGLFCYNRKNSNVAKYTTEEGLPTNQFNYASTFKDNQGNIFLGTVQGMVSFNPRLVNKRSEFPKIVFTNLVIGNTAVLPQIFNSPLQRELDNTDKIILNHKQAQFFGIEYAGISLGHSQNIIYAIKMEGLNPDWQIVNNQRKIFFSYLPAGKYTFKVKASSSKNIWDDSNIRTLEIVIKPPFYFSIFAIIIYFILGISIAFGVFKFLSLRLKEKNELRMNELEKEKLEKMNELKRNFFTNISHEFITPLTLIMSPVQKMISDPNIPKIAKDNLELVLNNSHTLMNLIKELIDFNRVEAEQVQIKVQKGNPLNFITEICYRFQVIMLEKELNFSFDIVNLEEEMWFDVSAVEKIVNNLLSNAFKFTSKGGNVKLFSSIIEDEEGSLFLKIVVSDSGIGISQQDQDKIFSAYYQVEQDDSLNKPKSGWGIGLSLVKGLTELHKGNVSIQSEKGKGSTFTVLLNVSANAFPIKNRLDIPADQDYFENYIYTSGISEEQKLSISQKEIRKIEKQKASILIVEDNAEMRKFLYDLFSEEFEVSMAQNASETIELMKENLPDILISDIMMPGMSGTELCYQIKTNLMTSHIPVVLLTAKTGIENTIKGYEFGADVYIEKPFNPTSLLLQIHNLIKTRDNNRKLFKESIITNVGVIANNKYDEKLLNDIKRVVEENIANEEFSVSDVTKLVGISRTMLHVKLKSMLDMSIGDYIRTIRIEKAKELLLKGDTIADTAYETGFSDPNYFSKCFKKQTGKTPSEFVKEHTKSN
jgi:ligand-binding sensor domain-containing protein/signal transduction histidine kinase/DNA-binding response OmpR family regulator